MERKVYDAAVEGNVNSLLNLLEEDALLLDRYITGRFPETPLHVASMLGHEEFVDQLLTRKPELAQKLDYRNSSPLHSAAAKGYLGIVNKLLKVNPDMCLVCDLDGRNPLHISAIEGHLDVLRELVSARPRAAWMLMDELGETILHACVRYNQLEAMKFLVDKVADHDLLNCQNYDGNTILHLAIAAKQTEAINFMFCSTTVDVNCQNDDGFTALDLLSQNQRDVKDKEIVESLKRMEAIRGKDKPLSNSQLKTARTKILTSSFTSTSTSTSNQTNAVSKKSKKKSKDRKRFLLNRKADWVERKRNTLMLVASLLATMAFQAGVNPPSGVWQESSKRNDSSLGSVIRANPPSGVSQYSSKTDDHKAGFSIMAYNSPSLYSYFIISNTVCFLSSLSIILLLISGLPIRRRFFMWVLMVVMWAAITAMALTYLISVTAFTPDDRNLDIVIVVVQLVWIGLMLLLLLGHTIRLMIRFIKYLRKLIIRLINIISTSRTGA